MMILTGILQFILVPLLSPLSIGVIRKMKAKLQNRQGANIFQPYRDLWKLFHKDEVISHDASWIFTYAPFIVFAVTLIVGMNIPLFTTSLSQYVSGDVLTIIYTLAIGTFFLALAGMDTGSAFGGFGSSREMTMSALIEGGLLFSLLAVALLCGTMNVFDIAASGVFATHQALLPLTLTFASFFIVLLAEAGRFPFDNPATHLELTMIHEAMILEYSGKKLALMEWASANKFIIFASLGANLFFPFGIAKTDTLMTVAIGCMVLMVKIGVFCMMIAWIESSIAKLRFFRLPDLLLTSFILSVVAIGLIK